MLGWAELGLSQEEAWGLLGFLRTEPDAETIRWEVDDIAGSLIVIRHEADLPLEPTHDSDIGDLLLVTEREERKIAVIDGKSMKLLAHIPASYRAHGYAFNPVEPRWAYNLGRDGWVFKIDLFTLKEVRKVRVGHDSRGLAISDDGKYLLAGNYIPNSAVILDADTLKPLKVIVTEGVDPDGEFVPSRVAITSDTSPELVGPYFLIALKEAGQVWRIDYSKPDFPVEKVLNVGRILHDGFLSPDNRRFYLAAQTDSWMAVIDVENMSVVERIQTGKVPHPGYGAVWEAEGKSYGATVHAGEGLVTIWDLQTNEIVGRVTTGGPGLFLRSHENSPYVWADALFGSPSNVITVFEKAPPFSKVKDISEGIMTLHPEFNADGSLVYISDWKGDSVRVYDAKTLERVGVIEDIVTPTGIFSTARRHETLGH
jgi:nitrite reductase (NO-forming)/hydroxylamine reductase